MSRSVGRQRFWFQKCRDNTHKTQTSSSGADASKINPKG
jgi:hypothetical protein